MDQMKTFFLAVAIFTSVQTLKTSGQTDRWKRALDDTASQRLIEDRTTYTAENVLSNRALLFKHQEELMKAWEVAERTHWKPVGKILRVGSSFSSGKGLSLTGTPAKPGDVVLVKREQEILPLLYLGEKAFSDTSDKRSFFIYPLSKRHGLEVNTMPPRWHREVLQKYGGITPKEATRTRLWSSEQIDSPQITVHWSRRKVKGSSFIPVKWWKPTTQYRVVRLSDNDFVQKLELRFERRKRDNQWVLTKWTDGERATWGEKKEEDKENDGDPFSLEKGDVILPKEHAWRELHERLGYGEYGLPLDPDPITTLDWIFGIIAFDPVSAKKYQSAYKIIDIDRDYVMVNPVVRIPFDAMTFPDDPPNASTKPQFRWLELDVHKNRAEDRFVWRKTELNDRVINHPFAKSQIENQAILEVVMRASVDILREAIDPSKVGSKALAATLKRAKKWLKKRWQKKFREALVKAFAKLDAPFAKATQRMVQVLVFELAKSRELQQHFQLQKQGQVSVYAFRAESLDVQQAVGKAADAFVTTLITEVLTDALGSKVKNDLFLERRVKYTLENDVTLDVIHADYNKNVRNWTYKFLITDNIASLVSSMNKALMAEDPAQFEAILIAELKKELLGKFSEGVKSIFILDEE